MIALILAIAIDPLLALLLLGIRRPGGILCAILFGLTLAAPQLFLGLLLLVGSRLRIAALLQILLLCRARALAFAPAGLVLALPAWLLGLAPLRLLRLPLGPPQSLLPRFISLRPHVLQWPPLR